MEERRDSKIVDLAALGEICDRFRDEGRRVVLCHGCFDFFHFGHLRHFKAAKRLGDILVVTITPDRFVNKGRGRPVFPEDFRMELVAALEVVDYVALNRWPSAVETIRMLRPAFFVKGSDYKGGHGREASPNIVIEERAVREIGGLLVFTDEVAFSSSRLLLQFAKVVEEDGGCDAK